MSGVEDLELGSAVSRPGKLDVEQRDPVDDEGTLAAFHGSVPGTPGGCTTEPPLVSVVTSVGVAVRA